MKRFWNILWRIAATLLLLLYVAIALVNYSVVQSFLGTTVGHFFSRQWGATVSIGSIEVTPWDHLSAHNLLLVSPDGDTILDAETLKLKFRHFPYKKGNIKDGGLNVGTLDLERLYLANAYYYFESIQDSLHGKTLTNLQFIIDHYHSSNQREHTNQTFTVDAKTVVLNHVHYRMDLPDNRKVVYPYGVQIPHMEFFDIRARIKDVHVVNDDVSARIVALSAEERSGFCVSKISGRVHVSNSEIRADNLLVETPFSHISLSALLSYDNWRVMNDYLNTVQHHADIHPGTSVALSDVAYWAPVLWGIDAQLLPSGSATGTINDISTNGLELSFGHASTLYIEGSVRMVSLIDSLNLDLQHLVLRVEQSDLSSLHTMLPQYITPQIAKKIDQLGYIDLNATAYGGLNRHSTANIDLICALGNLHADASSIPGSNNYLLTLDAGSDGLGLTSFGSDWLTHTGFALTAKMHVGNSKFKIGNSKLEGEAELQLTNSVLCGHHISPSTLRADLHDDTLTFDALCNDPLLDFSINATADIHNHKYSTLIDLRKLNTQILPYDFNHVNLNTTIRADAEGSTLDSLCGDLRAQHTHIQISKGTIDINDINLTLQSLGPSKRLRLYSDPLSLTADGRFSYSQLPIMLHHFLSQAIPANLLFVPVPDSLQLAAIADNTLTFTANWNDNGTFLSNAGSFLSIAKGSRLSGSYNHRELLKLALRSDSIRIGSILLDNLGLSSRNSDSTYIVDLESQQVALGKTTLFNRLNLSLAGTPLRTTLEILWGGNSNPSRGDLMLLLVDDDISVLKPNLVIANTPWTLSVDSIKLSTDNQHNATVTAGGVSLTSNQQQIVASLALRQRNSDHLSLDFLHFDIGPLCDLLLYQSPLDIDGRIDGHFQMSGFHETPYFNAALAIDSCTVNRQSLGLVSLRSSWNAQLGSLNLQLAGNNLSASGSMQLGQNDPGLNLTANFDNFSLALAAPFLSSFSSRFQGSLHGNFDISGTLSHPLVLGKAVVSNGALKIDPTGVTYFFSDSISFTQNAITLSNFAIRDHRNNIATLSGQIRYSTLDNIFLNLALATDNLLLLDQRRGDDLYGTLFASANATLSGSTDNLSLALTARTNPGCDLTVPLSNLKHVKTQNYITFVADNPLGTQQSAPNRQQSTLPIKISVDLSITPDLLLNLPIDLSELQASVRTTGNGDLHIDLDHSLTPLVTGNYEIIDGNLKLNMLSLIEKNFSIENNSNLTFHGPLPDAAFDLRAIYSQRANLSTLTGSLSSVDNTQKYIPVDNIIAVSGTLREPNVSFDLRLPNADQSVQEEVFSYIDRNSERDMINQTVSLLLLGQFYNVSGTDQNASNAASGSIGTIASTIGSFMADMVQIVDINVDYKAATEATNQQLDLNISKDWGRWYLESTLGYGGESRQIETSSYNGTVLDALIGYRLSPLIHLFAYNRTNTNDYTRTDLPYKQGVGIKLSKDFDSWSQLFGRKK